MLALPGADRQAGGGPGGAHRTRAGRLIDRTLITDDGVRLHVAAWPPPDAPAATVLICPGRTEPIAKYGETARDLVVRGFAVQGLDWRGQGLSERLVDNPEKGHVDSIDDYARDLETVLKDLAAGPLVRPLVLLSHSTGGLAVLHYLCGRPGTQVDGAAFSAPLLGIGGRPILARLAGIAAVVAVRLGLARRYALGHGDWQPEPFEPNKLTHDRGRFEAAQRLLGERPELRVAGATWGWVAAAVAGCRRMAAPGAAEAIRLPTLFAVAGQDTIADPMAARRFAARVDDTAVLELARSRHEILQETDDIRGRFLDTFTGFVMDLAGQRS